MNEHVTTSAAADRLELGEGVKPLFSRAAALAVLGLGGGVLWSLYSGGEGVRRFYHAYLISYCYFLSIALGALFFVLIQHVTRAGWSVNVRRVAECLAATLPVLAVLALPIMYSVYKERGGLYPWAQPESAIRAGAAEPAEPKTEAAAKPEHNAAPNHELIAEHAKLILGKRIFLNPQAFILRLMAYLIIWSAIATWYLRQSTRQDSTGDPNLTTRMQSLSAPALIVYAITVTLAVFDLLMSLDPVWYSTIFGVYFFAGSAVSGFAAIIIVLSLLQRNGYLASRVTTEHYHDLGKFLFGFVFFWGYIAFSQYMLMWYANLPEETSWYRHHGATRVPGDMNAWTIVCVMILLGNLLLPFAGLLSRHVKRNRSSLIFWAGWLLVFHWIDLYWIVMPQFDHHLHFGVVEVLTAAGLLGVFGAATLRIMASRKLAPTGDPRLTESVAFQNI